MTRLVARLALAGVSAIAAVVSYFHALAVVRSAGAVPPVAYLVPFLADLVILGASAALLDASRGSHLRPRLATFSLAAGIAVTVAMNVAAGVAHGLTGALVAGWPALAFILALESLVGMVRRGRSVRESRNEYHVAGRDEPEEPPSTDEALRLLLATGSRRVLADALSVPKSRVDSWAARFAQVAEVTAGPSLNGAAPDGS